MKKAILVLLTLCILLVCCSCGEGETNPSSDYVDSQNKVSESTPTDVKEEATDKKNFEIVNLGEKYTLDFLEITFDKVSHSQELTPTDTSGAYSYKADVENEQFFYLLGTMKNVGGEGYSVENIVAELVFDDKYTYTARIAADDGGNDFYGDYLEPFQNVTYYLYASVPDELLSQYRMVRFQFGFKEGFNGSYFDEFEECDYLYQLQATK